MAICRLLAPSPRSVGRVWKRMDVAAFEERRVLTLLAEQEAPDWRGEKAVSFNRELTPRMLLICRF